MDSRPETIYDQAHVELNRMMGRDYNNPLGETAFFLLERLVRQPRDLRVLDVGSGRGAAGRWWARRGARVLGLEPSRAMREESIRLARQEGLEDRIEHLSEGLEGLPANRRFDLALVHDVLCYLPDPMTSLRAILGAMDPAGLVSITDYHGVADHPLVLEIVQAWKIRSPWTFEAFHDALGTLPVRVLFHADTTRQYQSHWRQVGELLLHRRESAIAQVGPEPLVRFEAQVRAIETAVASGGFGHQWVILEVPG